MFDICLDYAYKDNKYVINVLKTQQNIKTYNLFGAIKKLDLVI